MNPDRLKYLLPPLLGILLFSGCTSVRRPIAKASPTEIRTKPKERQTVVNIQREDKQNKVIPAEINAANIEGPEKSKEFILTEALEKPFPEEAPPKPIPAPDKKGSTPEGEEQLLALNFDNADIYDVIHTLGELVGINYIIDPRVKGTVNIRTSEKVRKKEILPILEAIFRANNLTAVKEGNIYHIIPSAEAPRRFVSPRVGKEKGDFLPSDQVFIQIVPLDYIPVKDIINLIKPFLSPEAILTGYEKNNLLVITDFASNIKKALSIIETLDADVFKEVQFRLFALKNSKAEEVAKELELIFGALEVPTKTGRGGGVSFIPIPRTNSILVISSLPRVLIEVENWLQQLDQVIAEEELKTFVYFVENGTAKDLADVLNQLFGTAKPEEKGAPPARREETGPPGRRGRREPAPGSPETSLSQGSSAMVGAIAGEVKIIAHETTNSLIIRATPRDYRIVRQILKELDIMPRQVVIEAIIAEVSLDRSTQFGIEALLTTKSTTLGTEFGKVGLEDIAKRVIPGGGFTYNVIRGDVIATLNALASENKVHILSTPKIIASDNKEASIDIGSEVPLVSTEFRDVSAVGAVQTTIERRDTGVILKVTPHINSTGLVSLELDIEVSEAQEQTVAGQSDISIFQRKADTSLVVQDGQTLLIGGLMEDKRSRGREEVPFLGRLPLLGFFFSSTTRTSKQTELIALITPHVVRTLEEAEKVTEGYKEKVDLLRKKLEEMKEHELL